MQLTIQRFDALCELKTFMINGIQADYLDFGTKEDRCPENAEDAYSCGDMRFIGIEPTEAVLEKYSITEDEYRSIVIILEQKLSFGHCFWCS